MKYSILYPDPPWAYRDKNANGKRGAAFKYPVMSLKQLIAMRPEVDDLAAPDCAMAMWVTAPLLLDGLKLIDAWGFKYKTILFVWVKMTKGIQRTVPMIPKWHFGLGHWSRSNAELCLLGVRGRPKRESRSVRQLIVEPVREHSRKPEEARNSLVTLFGDVPRLEMFARERFPGWDVHGNQLDQEK